MGNSLTLILLVLTGHFTNNDVLYRHGMTRLACCYPDHVICKRFIHWHLCRGLILNRLTDLGGWLHKLLRSRRVYGWHLLVES